jgi:hypothetical protein
MIRLRLGEWATVNKFGNAEDRAEVEFGGNRESEIGQAPVTVVQVNPGRPGDDQQRASVVSAPGSILDLLSAVDDRPRPRLADDEGFDHRLTGVARWLVDQTHYGLPIPNSLFLLSKNKFV